MPKVADTFVVSADPDLVDMGKGIIGRIRGHSRQDFRVGRVHDGRRRVRPENPEGRGGPGGGA